MIIGKVIKKCLASLLSITIALTPFFPITAQASLTGSPSWYDPDGVGVGQDWHYRVPVTIPSNTAVNSTIKLNVNFQTLLTALGVNGTLDVNSPRIVNSNGTLVGIQEYTPIIFNGATDTTAGRGEVRFISENAGPYYIYFDITANGAKSVNPQTPIGGNFEKGTTGQAQPPGWNAPVKALTTFDAQIRPTETVNITTNTTDNNISTSTDGSALTGVRSYLLGSRTNNEPTSWTGENSATGATITKTITVPATNPGNLVFKYRLEGWDSNVNSELDQFDYFQAQINNTILVGPSLNNYTTLPFSPAYGTQEITNNQYGYGAYNSFDMDTRQRHKLGMTVGYGDEPWFTVTRSLAAFAGQTVTLTFFTHHTHRYKTWVHLDDIEWSVVNGTLGSPQAFGVQILQPLAATSVNSGSKVIISAQVDADPSNFVTANIYNASGTLVASNIKLYNDGTHGSSASTPAIWTNNGTDNANPTYTIPSGTATSSAWVVRVFNRDASTSTLGVTNGSVHLQGQPNQEIAANYYNIDQTTFKINSALTFTNLKTVFIFNDPINGTNNPKAIPGANAAYNILVTATSNGTPDANSIVITDAIPANTKMYVGDVNGAGSGPIVFNNGTPSSGLTYNFSGFNNAATNVKFSNNNGATWTYIPTADINGHDAAVTNIRINPQGTMNGASGSSTPNFSIFFGVGIK